MRYSSIIFVLYSFIFFGCARFQNMETKISHTDQRVAQLQKHIENISKAIDDLNINQGGATSKMRADLTMQLKQLDEQLDRLHAEMDESQFRMRQLEKKVDMVANQRLLTTGTQANLFSDSAGTLLDSTKTAQSLSQTRVVPGLEIEKLYHQAREDYITGKYKLAFKGFKTVFEKDHGGSFKDNALYWMGECHYKQGEFSKAIGYYQQCVQGFPRGNKMCSALFKAGMTFEKQKEKPKRDSTWTLVLEKCKGTNESHRVQAMMGTAP